jgi:hypothetical protein
MPYPQTRALGVPTLCWRYLATRLAPAQPEGQDDMGDGGQAGRPLASRAPDISSLAGSTLSRQTPEVGAVCGNAARMVLCGGRPVTGVPTAINSLIDNERRPEKSSNPRRRVNNGNIMLIKIDIGYILSETRYFAYFTVSDGP